MIGIVLALLVNDILGIVVILIGLAMLLARSSAAPGASSFLPTDIVIPRLER